MFNKYSALAALLAAKAAAESTTYIGCYPATTSTVTVTPKTGTTTSVPDQQSDVKTVTVTKTETATVAVMTIVTMNGGSSLYGNFTGFTTSSWSGTGTVFASVKESSETVTTTTIYSTSTLTSTIPFPAMSTSTKITSMFTKTSSSSKTVSSATGLSNALYFTNWGIYGANYQPQQIPADKATHILYSFANINLDGTVVSSDSYADLKKHYSGDSWNDQGTNAYGCVKQLYALKKQYRHLKTLLSIGGWTFSSKFAPVAATKAGRETFCKSALTLVKDWGMDGIDIDWEYPLSAQETEYYVKLVKECRAQFDAYSAKYADDYHFQITVASPEGSANIKHMDLPGMDPYIDAWHLMAYDYAGSRDNTSGHQANVYPSTANKNATKFSTEAALELYLSQNISASKIVLGMPLYGRTFTGTTGLGKPYTGLDDGSIKHDIWPYRDLPRPGATEYFDDKVIAAWSYDNSTEELVSYDTVTSAKAKTKYLLEKGLGGAVYWEASGDKNGTQSIVATVADALDLDQSKNLLSYPQSVYDNIKNGLE